MLLKIITWSSYFQRAKTPTKLSPLIGPRKRNVNVSVVHMGVPHYVFINYFRIQATIMQNTHKRCKKHSTNLYSHSFSEPDPVHASHKRDTWHTLAVSLFTTRRVTLLVVLRLGSSTQRENGNEQDGNPPIDLTVTAIPWGSWIHPKPSGTLRPWTSFMDTIENSVTLKIQTWRICWDRTCSRLQAW